MSSQPNPTLSLLGLPAEIRREIQRYVLHLQCGPHRTTVNLDPHFSTCRDCPALARRRDELRGAGGVQNQVLLVCRQLYMDGLTILAENHFVAVHRPRGHGDELHSELGLSSWKIATGVTPNVRPVMTFSISNRRPYQTNKPAETNELLFFDLRDLHLVVRYLLHYCRRFQNLVERRMEVSIDTLHVPGLCTRNDVAQKLFLDTVWPWLNAEIEFISLNRAESLINFDRKSLEPLEVWRMNGRSPETTRIFKSILDTIKLNSGPTPGTNTSRWNLQPAREKWCAQIQQIFILCRTGLWPLNTPWEVFAHETLHSLDDQAQYESLPQNWLEREDYVRVIVPDLARVHFLIATICLNVAYLTPQDNYLSKSSDQLNRQALGHFRGIEDLPIDHEGIPLGACCTYTRLASAEAYARLNMVKKAWFIIYQVLRTVKPNSGGPSWVQDQMHEARTLRQHYITSEGENRPTRWIQDPNFRARFFRQYTKGEVVPLIKQKYGADALAFFREAVPEDVDKWTTQHKGSLKRA